MTGPATALTDAFERLVDVLESRGSTIRRYLNPGAPRDRVAEALEAVGARPHAELVELYSWHDGTDHARIRADTDAGPQLVPATAFPPLLAAQKGWEDSSTLYRERLTERAFAEPGPGAWPALWYPVFSGDVALDLGTGNVWRYEWPWSGSNRYLADSLTELADRIVTSLERGTAVIEGVGYFVQSDI